MMKVSIGNTVLKATLNNNPSVTALKELLAKGPLTIDMHDYGSFEKVGPIGKNIVRSDKPTTTSPGDIILYEGKYLTIYYGVNSWNFTLIGKINDVSKEQLKQILGEGNVKVTFSLD
ncbi:hypothetical protein M9Y10_031002 [Tritrichomonas musculus]|uniref:Cyclophilin-like domain-containing protein n=1 Tax=Tritrichomonas musculus TaxID=1915356 RepID=A0ABR2H1I8_9EUKA